MAITMTYFMTYVDRSDKLWEQYIQWERDNNNPRNVLAVFDRLISMPTLSYQGHFQK